MVGRAAKRSGVMMWTKFTKGSGLIDSFDGKFGSTTWKRIAWMQFRHRRRMKTTYERGLLENCHQFTEEATRMAMEILEGRE